MEYEETMPFIHIKKGVHFNVHVVMYTKYP